MNNFCSKDWFIDLCKKAIKQMDADVIVVISSSIGSSVTITNTTETYTGVIDDNGMYKCRILSSGDYTITVGSDSTTYNVGSIISGKVYKIQM